MGQIMDLFSNRKETAKLRAACTLSDEELETFHMETGFDLLSILRYFNIFSEYHKCLSKDQDKLELTHDEFKEIPPIKISPLKDQIVRVIPSRTGSGFHEGNIDFAAFLRLLAITNGQARKADKLRYAFNMYDIDGDGKVSVDDLKKYTEMCTDFAEQDRGEVAKYKELLNKAVDQTFAELGRTDFLRLEDFAKTLIHTDFAHKYKLHIETHMDLAKVQKLIDKTQTDITKEEARQKKEEDRIEALYLGSPEGKAETKAKEEAEEAKKAKDEEEKKAKDEEEKKAREAEEKKKKEAEEKKAAEEKKRREAEAKRQAAEAEKRRQEELQRQQSQQSQYDDYDDEDEYYEDY